MEDVYKRLNVLEQNDAVKSNQIKTLEGVVTNLICKLEELTKDTNAKLTIIQTQLMRRLPAWATIVLTLMSALIAGLVVNAIKH